MFRFILLGILVSYLTQHYRIIARRSSEGISPYFILLGVTGGTCALSNILVLPASRADLACCHEISGFACFAGLLGIFQVALQWSCFAIMYVLDMLPYQPNCTCTKSTQSASVSSLLSSGYYTFSISPTESWTVLPYCSDSSRNMYNSCLCHCYSQHSIHK